MKKDVVCIGQAVVDCIVRGKEESASKKNVYLAQSIALSVGGDAVNEATVLAELGHNVELVCGMADDPAGHLILEEMHKHGVCTEHVSIRNDLITPIANLVVNGDGSRSSINSPAVMLGEYHPDLSVVKGSKIVSFASLFRAPFDQPQAIIDLVKAAKEEGCIVCADTKLPTYRNIHMRDIQEILPMIDYIFPNENEALYYTGERSFSKMAEAIQKMGVRNVIVKTGTKGCTVLGEKEQFEMPARDVIAVDSTGAGDSFVAGFLSGILKGYDLRACAEYGTDCAAKSVQYMGATKWTEK